MATFGEDLKSMRESRGVALNDIAQQTKVSIRHLQALEADRLDILPGGVFNRGILRNYLQFFAVDETDWLARFSQIPGSSGPTMKEGDWPRQPQLVPGFKPSPMGEEDVRFRWLGIGLLFLVLIVAGWFTYRFAAGHWRLHPWHARTAQHALLYSGYVFHGQAAPPNSI
jgi:cytoskeleton protein RodZ